MLRATQRFPFIEPSLVSPRVFGHQRPAHGMADALVKRTAPEGKIDALGGNRRVMTLLELSEYMGVPRRILYILAANRSATGFPAYRNGREWRAELGEVIQWLVEKHERGEDLSFVTQRLKREAFRGRRLLH